MISGFIVGPLCISSIDAKELNGRYWYLEAVSPDSVVSVVPDLFQAQCMTAMHFLVTLGWAPEKIKCELENSPPTRE